METDFFCIGVKKTIEFKSYYVVWKHIQPHNIFTNEIV